MTKITRDEVLRVAALANLELSGAEVDTFAQQLDGILSYVEKLNELDTDGVEPMSQVTPPPGDPSETVSASAQGTPLREDVIVPNAVIGEVLAGAPDPYPPYFRVPRVIDRGENREAREESPE